MPDTSPTLTPAPCGAGPTGDRTVRVAARRGGDVVPPHGQPADIPPWCRQDPAAGPDRFATAVDGVGR